jgi:hypothetical protein
MQIYQEMEVASIASAIVAQAIPFLDCVANSDHTLGILLLAMTRLFGNVVAQFIGPLRLMNQATIPFFVFARHDSAEAISLGDNEIATPRQVGVHNDMESYYPMLLSYYKVSPLYLSFRTKSDRLNHTKKRVSCIDAVTTLVIGVLYFDLV